MPDLKYSSQEDSLAYGIRDVHRNEFLTDCYFIAEGGERIKCHQCMLVCSPILKSILNSLDFRVGGNAAALSIPDFHPESIRKLLHFLYEGEVSLQKGSRTLIEFKELCNLLEINPPVNKYRSVDDEDVKEETEELLHNDDSKGGEEETTPTPTPPCKELEFEECPSIPCEFCTLHFQDRATYEAHVSECEIKTLDSFKMPDNFDLPEEIIRSTGGPPSYAEGGSDSRKAKSDSSDSEGFEDILTSSSIVVDKSPKESPGHIEKKKKSSSKLIDDLFGEDPTSSSIKKTVSPKPERKSVGCPSSKKEASAKSVIDELNEKRKRTISKLKDTVIPSVAQQLHQSKSLLPPRPKTPNNHSKWLVNDSESSESDVIDEDIGDRKLFKKRSSKKRFESLKVKIEKARISTSESSEDESSSDINEDSLLSRTPRAEKAKRKVQRGGGSTGGGGKRLRVSVQLDGKEPFIEYATYKLRLLCGSDEETEKEDGGGDSSSSDEFSSRLRRVRKKDPSSYEETKWDKLKLKRLERSKSVSEIKSIIESKVMSKQASASVQSNKGVDLKRSISESSSSSSPGSSSSPHLKKPHYDTKISNRPNPYPSFNFNYGLSTENKLLGEKSKSEALLSLSKVSFKKKMSQASPGSKADPPASSSSSSNPSN